MGLPAAPVVRLIGALPLGHGSVVLAKPFILTHFQGPRPRPVAGGKSPQTGGPPAGWACYDPAFASGRDFHNCGKTCGKAWENPAVPAVSRDFPSISEGFWSGGSLNLIVPGFARWHLRARPPGARGSGLRPARANLEPRSAAQRASQRESPSDAREMASGEHHGGHPRSQQAFRTRRRLWKRR